MADLQGKNLSISLKKSKEKPNLKHNRREGEYPENADPSRQDLNVAILHGDPRHEYKVVFGEALDEYNAKQKRNDRKIKDYYSHVYNSDGKQKPYEEFIIGLGNKDDWENATVDEFEAGVEVVTQMVYEFRRQNPKMHFINADVHGDESHPHAHIIAVPVGEGYKRGLSKQVSFSKALEGQGYRRTEFQEWRDDQMSALESIASKHGISRKHVGTNGYKDQEHYKQAKDEIKEIARKEHGVLDLKTDMIESRENKVAEEERRIEQEKEELEKEKAELKAERESWAEEKRRQVSEAVNQYKDDLQKRFNVLTARFDRVVDGLNVDIVTKNAFKNYIKDGRTGYVSKATKQKTPIEKYQKNVKEGHVYHALKNAEAVEDDGIEL